MSLSARAAENADEFYLNSTSNGKRYFTSGEDLYTFNFTFPSNLPENVLGCLSKFERSILFDPDPEKSAINKKLDLLATLLLRSCLTTSIALHYRKILPELLLRCVKAQHQPSLFSNLDLWCGKHKSGFNSVVNDLYQSASIDHNDSEFLKESTRLEEFSHTKCEIPIKKIVCYNPKEIILWMLIIIALGELIPYLPHLSPFATKVLEMRQCFHSCVEILKKKSENSHMLEYFLRSLFRLLSHSAATFSVHIPTFTFIDFISSENPMVRSYAINCLAYSEGWTDYSLQNLLKKYEFPLHDVNPLQYYSPANYERKLTESFCDQTFKHSIECLTLCDKDCVGVKFGAELLSPGLVDISGVLLNKCLDTTETTFRKLKFSKIPSRNKYIHQFATAVSVGDSILLEGKHGSGKTSLAEYISSSLAVKKLFKLVLNEQSDPRLLIGTYVCSSNSELFEWKPGVLTTAINEGSWVLVENIDSGPIDIISVFSSLLESKYLYIPNRAERIVAKSGFQIIATCTDASRLNINKNLWHHIHLPELNESDLKLILESKYEYLQPYSDVLIEAYNFAYQSYMKPYTHHGRKSLVTRDLFKLANRLNRFLKFKIMNNLQLKTDEFELKAVEYTFDCFFASLFSTPYKMECHKKIAHIYGLRYDFDTLSIESGLPSNYIQTTSDTDEFESILKNPYHSSETFELTHTTIKYLKMIYTSCIHNEPVLMVGETGTGKTTIVQNLSRMLNMKLTVINMSRESELSDLLGGFKPISEQKFLFEIYENFKMIFSDTFNPKSNLSFINIMESAMHKKNFNVIIRGFRKAIAAAYTFFVNKYKKCPNHTKTLCTNSHSPQVSLPQDWQNFSDSVNEFECIVKSKTPVRFHFIKGSLSKAIVNGEYVLLDEINLASKETLDHLSTLIENEYGSVTLIDKGDSAPLTRSSKFRIFACMNPSSDFGKKELDPIFRSRFTEFWVNSPADNIDELKFIIQGYLKNCLSPVKKDADSIINDIAKFYTEIILLSRDALISDTSGMQPSFSPRTLFRALSFTSQILAYCNIHRAVYEGINLCFLSSLDEKSLAVVDGLLSDKYKNAARNRIPMKHPHSITRSKNKRADEYVKIGPFWLKAGPLSRDDDSAQSFIITPSVEVNLINLCRAVTCGKYPIIIQGPTSVGKTSIIEYLAKRLGHKFVRINNHQHTEIQEYIGSWAPSSKSGKLEFIEGVLLQSLRNGYWLVLDELNMAPSDIIEALDRLLDDNRELLVSETQEIVKPHPNFMLFATQNPAGLYDGRNYLSRSLRNRFLELHFSELPSDELLTILSERTLITPSFAKRIINVYNKLQQSRSRNNIFEGRHSYITLRDLFKWANRDASSYEELAINGWFIIGERSRKDEDRALIKQILEEEMKVKTLDLNKVYNDYSEKIIGSLEKLDLFGDSIVFTKFFRRIFTLVYTCVTNKEPVLLIGETGVGKTTLCQLIAKTLEKELYIINVHQNSTTQDFIGGQGPVRTRSLLIDEIKANLIHMLTHLAIVEDEFVNLSDTTIEKTLNFIKDALDQTPNERIRQIFIETESMWLKSRQIFCWCDGPLVNAMNKGGFLLIDEISLADSSIIERLNSALEPERTLVLAEKSCSDGVCVIRAEDGFNIFATMNPGGDYGKKELSPALRNRFTEIWVPSIDSKSDIKAIIGSRLGDFNESPDIQKSISKWILDFTLWLAEFVGKQINEISSLRDLITWAQFINRTYKSLGLKKAFIHGGCITFLDGIWANPKFSVYSNKSMGSIDGADDFVTVCKKKLLEIAQEDWWDPNESFRVVGISTDAERNSNFVVSPFSISAGPIPRTPDDFFSLEAPTTILNLGRIMRALQLEKPILLEGPPGVGKTSLVMALASLAGYNFTRINLSDQTDIMDLFGSDLPKDDNNGGSSFSWHYGPFLHALKTNRWVLLDELNLADQNVLEGLNSCLDHRQEIYIPTLDLIIKKSPGFRIFAAQNPHNLGGGRKGLPKSFLNRFTVVHVDQMSVNDEEVIIKTLFANDRVSAGTGTNPDTLVRMCKFNDSVAKEVLNSRICTTMGNPEFNLRDVVRWARLMQIDHNTYGPEKYLCMLYLHRLRSYDDRIVVKRLFETIFGYNIPNETFISQFTINKDFLRIGCAIYKRLDNALTPGKSSENLQILSSRLPYLESLLKSVQAGYLPLLIGPEGCGKISSLRILARLCGRNLVEVPLSPSTDISDLLGSFEQISKIRPEEEFRQNFSILIKYIIWKCLSIGVTLPDNVFSAIEEMNNFERIALHDIVDIGNIIQSLKSFTSCAGFLNDSIYTQKLNLLSNSFDTLISSLKTPDSKGRFSWVDGPVTKAVREGQWIVLVNANLCSPSILDRLNPIFETNGSLLLSERGLVDGEFEVIRINRNFRVFMTMDSKYGELSRAMRNRSVETFMSQEIINVESESFIIDNDIVRLGMTEKISLHAVKVIRKIYERVCDETHIEKNFFGRLFLRLLKIISNLVNKGESWDRSLIQTLEYLNFRSDPNILSIVGSITSLDHSQNIKLYPIFKEYLNNSEITSSSRFFSTLTAMLMRRSSSSIVDLHNIYRAAYSFLHCFTFDASPLYKLVCNYYGHNYDQSFLTLVHDESLYLSSFLSSSVVERRFNSTLNMLGVINLYDEFHHIFTVDDIKNIGGRDFSRDSVCRLRMIRDTPPHITLHNDNTSSFNLEVEKIAELLLTIYKSLIDYTISSINYYKGNLVDHVKDFIRFIEGFLDMCSISEYINVMQVITFMKRTTIFFNEVSKYECDLKIPPSLISNIENMYKLLNYRCFEDFLKLWEELSEATNSLHRLLDGRYDIHEERHKFFNHVCPCSIGSSEERYMSVITPSLRPKDNNLIGELNNFSSHIYKRITDTTKSCLLTSKECEVSLSIGNVNQTYSTNIPNLGLQLLFSNDDIVRLVTLPLYDYLSLTRELCLIKTLLTSNTDTLSKTPTIEQSVMKLIRTLSFSSMTLYGIKSIASLLNGSEHIHRALFRNIILNWYIFFDSNSFTALYDDALDLHVIHSHGSYVRAVTGIYHDVEDLSNIVDCQTAIECLETVMNMGRYQPPQIEYLPYDILMFFLRDLISPFCNEDRKKIINSIFEDLSNAHGAYKDQASTLLLSISSWPFNDTVSNCLRKVLTIIHNQLCGESHVPYEIEIGKALMYTSFASADVLISGLIIDPVDILSCESQILENQVRSLLTQQEFLKELYDSYLISSTRSDQMLALKSIQKNKESLIELLSKKHFHRNCTREVKQELFGKLKRLKHSFNITTIENWIEMLQERDKKFGDIIRETITQNIRSLEPYIHTHTDIVNPIILAFYNIKYATRLVSSHKNYISRDINLSSLIFNTHGVSLEDLNIDEFKNWVLSKEMQKIVGITNGSCLVPLLRKASILLLVSGVSFSNTLLKINLIMSHAAQLWTICEKRRNVENSRKSNLYKLNESITDDSDKDLELELPCGREYYYNHEDSNVEVKPETVSDSADTVDMNSKALVESLYLLQQAHVYTCTNFGNIDVQKLSELWKLSIHESYEMLGECVMKDSSYSYSAFNSHEILIQGKGILERLKLDNKPFDIYNDSYPSEVEKIRHFCINLHQRLLNLLNKWPGHDMLLILYKISLRLLTFHICTPLPKVLYAILMFLSKVDDWEKHASKEDSLVNIINEACRIVNSWRKVELESWKRSLDIEERKYEMNCISRMWLYLWNSLDYSNSNEEMSNELIQTLNDYMTSSTLGDFFIRLKSIDICIRCFSGGNYKGITRVIANTHAFYSQFETCVRTEIEIQRKSSLEKLRVQINANHMKNVVYYSMKEEYDVGNRKLLKILKEYRKTLENPIQYILSDFILKDFSKLVYDESQNLQECSKCSNELIETHGNVSKMMWKLFGQKFFMSKLDVANYVKSLIFEINDYTGRYKSKGDRICEDENTYKSRKAQRRVNLHRLFKELKTSGLSHVHLIPKSPSIHWILSTQYSQHSGSEKMLKSCNHFLTFLKMEKMRALQSSIHSDISKKESSMCLGFMESIMNVQIGIRESLLNFMDSMKMFKTLTSKLSAVKDSDIIFVYEYGELLTTLKKLKNFVDIVSVHVVRGIFFENEFSKTKESSHMDNILTRIKIIKSDVDAICQGIAGLNIGLLTSSEVNLILESANDFDSIISIFYSKEQGVYSDEVKHIYDLSSQMKNFLSISLRSFLLTHCKIFDYHGEENHHVSSTEEGPLLEFKKCMLKSFQVLLSEQSEYEDIDFRRFCTLISKKLPKLDIDNLRTILENLLLSTHPKTIYLSTSGYLYVYIHFMDVTQECLSKSYDAISLLSLLLSNLFLCLHVSGFCLELKDNGMQGKDESMEMDNGVMSAIKSAKDQDSKFEGELGDLSQMSDELDRGSSNVQEDDKISDDDTLSLDMNSDGGQLSGISGDSDLGSDISAENDNEDNTDVDSIPESYNEALWDDPDISIDDNKSIKSDINASQECETSKKDPISSNDTKKLGKHTFKDEPNTSKSPVENLSDGVSSSDADGDQENEEEIQHASEDDNLSINGNISSDGDNTEVDKDDNFSTHDEPVVDEGSSTIDEKEINKSECAKTEHSADTETAQSDMNLDDENSQRIENNDNTDLNDNAKDDSNYSQSNPVQLYGDDNQEMEPGFNGDTTLETINLENKHTNINNDTPLQEQTQEDSNDHTLDMPNNEASIMGAAVTNKDFKISSTSHTIIPDRDKIRAQDATNITNNIVDSSGNSHENDVDMNSPVNTDVNFEFIKSTTAGCKRQAQAYSEVFDDQINNYDYQFPNGNRCESNEKEHKEDGEHINSEVKPKDNSLISVGKELADEVTEKFNMNIDTEFSISHYMDISEDNFYNNQNNKFVKACQPPEQVDEINKNDNEFLDNIETSCSKFIDCHAGHTNSDNLERLKIAREIWNTYTRQTTAQVARLSEQLQLILKPSLASKFRGDYKTGKRINMRRLISYVASSYRKDRIWLRRTYPNKRCYQVMLCIDDSLSMSDMKCTQLAFKSLVVISRALSMSEIGDTGVMSFGETLKLIHPFGKPITDEAGAQILTQFTFSQRRTLITRMMEAALKIFQQSRHLLPHFSSTHNDLDLRRLQIIISDGICEDHEKIRSLCRLGSNLGLMTAFIILDTRSGGESIREIKNVIYTSTGPSSPPMFTVNKYMETFPFDYFVIINNIEMLPDILSDVIKQYIELSAQ